MQAEELTAEFGIAGILDFVETEHGLVKAARDLRKIIRHRKLRFVAMCLDHGNSSMVMRICRISSRSFRRSAGASGD